MSDKEKAGLDLSGQHKTSQDKGQHGHDGHGHGHDGHGQDGHGQDKHWGEKSPVEPRLEPLLQAHIGKQLRDMFENMAREPVPDRFRSLLDRLEAGELPASVSASQPADDEAGAK